MVIFSSEWSGEAMISLTSLFSDEQAKAFANELAKEGVVVLPIYNDQELRTRHKNFARTLTTFPEYKQGSAGKPVTHLYVKGGFGALGNPASFHNKFVRDVRLEVFEKVAAVFKELLPIEADVLKDSSRKSDRKLEEVLDRMRVFPPGNKVMAESWHRDLSPTEFVEVGDSIFGGWINFDPDFHQSFSCFKTSHRLDILDENKQIDFASLNNHVVYQGFKKVSKEQQVKLNTLKQSRGADGTIVQVPPGNMIIFYQEMVHEVLAANRKTHDPPSYRLFTAWRLTSSRRSFEPTNPPNYFTEMPVPKIKSGQEPPMWPLTGNWVGTDKATEGLQNWSRATFHKELLQQKVKNPNNEKQRTFTVIPRNLPSLSAISKLRGLEWPISDDYPAYSDEEKTIYRPNSSWTIGGRTFSLR